MRLVVSSDEEPLSLFQDLARDHPPGSDYMCSLSTVATQCRGPSSRAWDRGEPRDDPVLVEPVRPDLRRRSFFRLQSLQPGTTPLLTRQFQAQPRRRTRRVASARGGLIPCRRWRTQSLRFSSDSASRALEEGLQGDRRSVTRGVDAIWKKQQQARERLRGPERDYGPSR